MKIVQYLNYSEILSDFKKKKNMYISASLMFSDAPNDLKWSNNEILFSFRDFIDDRFWSSSLKMIQKHKWKLRICNQILENVKNCSLHQWDNFYTSL